MNKYGHAAEEYAYEKTALAGHCRRFFDLYLCDLYLCDLYLCDKI